MNTAARTRLVAALVTLVTTGAAASAQHSGDVWVGHTSGSRLAVSPAGFVPGANYYTLTPVSGLLEGWSDNSPGFDRITAPEPEHDVYPLEPGCAIWLEVVAIDAALRLIDGAWQILDAPGEATYLGDHTLHVHNTWHVNSDDPAFELDQCVWRATFILRDDGSTGYSTSKPFTFNFTNVLWGPALEPPEWASGDFDLDVDVDLDDFDAFAVCMNGPAFFADPDDPMITLCEVDCVNAFDFGEDHDEVDLDVDLADFAAFQATFNGGR